MEVTLSLIVLRCKNLSASLSFYERLGLCFAPEQHGSGPSHYSTNVSGIIFELYPAQSSEAPLDPNRIGVNVPSLAGTLQALQELDIHAISIQETNTMAIVLDPDGRKVEITELNTQFMSKNVD